MGPAAGTLRRFRLSPLGDLEPGSSRSTESLGFCPVDCTASKIAQAWLLLWATHAVRPKLSISQVLSKAVPGGDQASVVGGVPTDAVLGVWRPLCWSLRQAVKSSFPISVKMWGQAAGTWAKPCALPGETQSTQQPGWGCNA